MRKISIIIVSVLIVSSLLVGCEGVLNEGEPAQNSEPQTDGNKANESITEQANIITWDAVLYFSDREGMNIIKREKEIVFIEDVNKQEGTLTIGEKSKLSIEALIEGIKGEDVTTTIPPETDVLSVVLDDKTLIVDLSKEFEQNHIGGSTGIMMTMAPLVLTLTEFEEVEQVKFIVEGNVLEDFKGHIEFNRPFARGEYTQYLK